LTFGTDHPWPMLLSTRAAEARGCPGRAALQAAALDSSGWEQPADSLALLQNA